MGWTGGWNEERNQVVVQGKGVDSLEPQAKIDRIPCTTMIWNVNMMRCALGKYKCA